MKNKNYRIIGEYDTEIYLIDLTINSIDLNRIVEI